MIITIDGQITKMTIERINGTSIHYGARINIGPIWGNVKDGDPIHRGCMRWFRNHLKAMYGEELFTIRDLSILLSKNDNRYYLNGVNYPQTVITNALARILLKSCNEEKSPKLLSSLYQHLALPENISYALENRVPFSFHHRHEGTIDRQDVRLNVKQIGKKEFAIEISDGIWGTISQTDLNTFINSGRFNHKRGKWHTLSPQRLFGKLMGREATSSEMKIMIAFLMQNRKRDIVEKRARELLETITETYKDRVSFIDEPSRYVMFIRGNDYDWMLVSRGKTTTSESRQSVNTYVWQKGNGNKLQWRGPICIDNLMGGSSMGDQLVARVMPLLNDSVAMTRVNTIGSYIEGKTRRLSLDSMIEKYNKEKANIKS
jgi:hypothetical protein